MAALWSFGQVAGREMGREQFLAFYHSAGVLASLASHLWTVCLLSHEQSLSMMPLEFTSACNCVIH